MKINVYSDSYVPETNYIKLVVSTIKEKGIFFLLTKILNFLEVKFIISSRFFRSYKSIQTFLYEGESMRYFCHDYNTTWINERAVEVPIILDYIRQHRHERILEVGSVLTHYTHVAWDVLDKFEKRNRTINEDIETFKPSKKYDFIVCISTLEHIGFDDDIVDPVKISRALNNIKKNCLTENGTMVATIPIGYNKALDKSIFSKQVVFDKMFYLKKISRYNNWEQTDEKSVMNLKYGTPFLSANGIIIALLRN